MRILVVDDSIVFRSQIAKALADVPGVEVVGSASNGRIAIQKLEQGSIDLVTLDMEMPEMDGTDVLREIKRQGFSVRVIVFSGQTQQGAASALEALSLGAHDVVAKPVGSNVNFENAYLAIRSSLLPKIMQFMAKEQGATVVTSPVLSPERSSSPNVVEANSSIQRGINQFYPSLIVIGSSTGGPNALEKIFTSLNGELSIPIVIVQHMPPVFTQMLAKRLSDISGLSCHEAKNGEELLPNKVYVAPGDFHLVIEAKAGKHYLALNQLPQRNSVRPAVDFLFESAASLYGANCLGVVLTGMGEDGLVGARAIRKNGGRILIQNKESCIVFGMPGAIFENAQFDQIMPLDQIGSSLFRMSKQHRQSG